MLALSLGNIIGLVALTMTVVALTRTSNKGLLATLGAAVSLWAIHYGLLGSVSGFAVHVVAAVSLFVAHLLQRSSKRVRATTGVLFSLMGVSVTAYFGTGLADVLAAVGCVIMTMTQFTGKGDTLRVGFMTGETVFFGFALILGSVPGMIVTAGNFLAGGVGLVRRHRAAQLAGATD
ncbi:YgjV family protein [Marinobacter shengliensis]|uniref:YgjV family protein n=1 Tax=Marinobacter shengliensis TaxID=1389223 RepID=UPI001108BCA1|nr:YgjV family protein [Marinobacter shengliensis]